MPQTDGGAKSERDWVLVDIALQGGGSHGSFAWGALDRLLDVTWIAGIGPLSMIRTGVRR